MYLARLTEEAAPELYYMLPEAFQIRQNIYGVVCLDDHDLPLGIAVVRPDSDTVHSGKGNLITEWLYVLPEHRRIGVGSMLIKGIMDMARVNGAAFVEGCFRDSEEGMEEFFLKNGFLVLEDEPLYSFELSALFSSQKSRALPKPGVNCVSLSEAEAQSIRILRNNIIKLGYPDYLSICSKDISFLYMGEGLEPTGCILSYYDPDENMLNVSLLINFDAKNPSHTLMLVSAFIRTSAAKLPADSRVSFVGANENMRLFLEKLLPSRESLEESGKVLCALCETASYTIPVRQG